MNLTRSTGAAMLALLLVGCGGQEPPRVTAPLQATLAAQAAPAPLQVPAPDAPLRVGYVEYLQPDPATPGIRRYQALQVLLELEQADAKKPALELQASGRLLGRIALARHGSGHWSATIPAAWALNGLNWRAVAANHGPSTPQAVPLAD